MSEEATTQSNGEVKIISDTSKDNGSDVILPNEGQKCGCNSNMTTVKGPPSYIYALGRVSFRFPNKSIEKELAQIIGLDDTKDLTSSQALRSVLTKKENRYLARKLCWLFSIGDIETYILIPREPSDLDALLESLRESPRPTDIDLVIGIKGPIAGPHVCNGLMLPLVVIDQLYSFDYDSLLKSVPKAGKGTSKQFILSAEELLIKIIHLSENGGATDEHRALNYLAVRYPAIYENIVNCHSRNYSLSSIQSSISELSGARKILDVIFSYTERSNDVIEKYFVRVDVTEEFPFLVSKLSPYYQT